MENNTPQFIESAAQAKEITEFTKMMTERFISLHFSKKPMAETYSHFMKSLPQVRPMVQVFCAERRLHPAVECYITMSIISSLAGTAAVNVGLALGVGTVTHITEPKASKGGEQPTEKRFDPSQN